MADREPASIRYANPAAMYPGPIATRFGSTGYEIIGGGHKIAVFPDPVSGAAAQFALLDSGGYRDKTLADAITRWSGGNSSPGYIAAVASRAGLSPDTRITADMLRDPKVAIPLARAMAGWEAGRPSPLSDDDWKAAHGRAFSTTGAPTTVASADDAAAPWKPSAVPMPLAVPSAPATAETPPAASPGAPAMVSSWDTTTTPASSAPFSLSAGDPKQTAALQQQMAAQEREKDPMPQHLAMGGRPVDLQRLMSVLQQRSKLGSGGMA